MRDSNTIRRRRCTEFGRRDDGSEGGAGALRGLRGSEVVGVTEGSGGARRGPMEGLEDAECLRGSSRGSARWDDDRLEEKDTEN